MKFTRTCIVLAGAAIIVAANAMSPQSATTATAQATAQPKQSGIDSADRLFQVGKFAEAGKLYSQIVAQNPKDYSAITSAGSHRIAFEPARRHAKMAGKSNSPEAERNRSQGHVGPGVLSPRRFPKSSGFTQGRRRKQQQAD